MNKVFAVLFFLFFLCGCVDKDKEDIQTISSTFKNNLIYSAPGDFDGDKKLENIFITQDDSRYCLNLINSGKLYNRELGFSIDNLNSFIHDINNDNREELILNVIQDNCENCYVFTYSEGLYNILSPEMIIRRIDFKKLEKAVANDIKNTESGKKALEGNTYVKLYYTEMEYGDGEPLFISEGVIYNKDQVMFNIRISSRIDKKNQIVLDKVQVNPLSN